MIAFRNEIRDLQQKVGLAMVFMTLDQEEALDSSDKVIVMNKGHIAQIGTPKELMKCLAICLWLALLASPTRLIVKRRRSVKVRLRLCLAADG